MLSWRVIAIVGTLLVIIVIKAVVFGHGYPWNRNISSHLRLTSLTSLINE